MADNKPTVNQYRNLGGINQKASEYSIDKAQFLNLSNLDFDVPNALSKRTGSTQAIGLNTSGPINSLFEFIKLDGSSYVIAGDNTAMWYKTGTSLTVLDSGWTNGQPADMLTFLNQLWMANGQKYRIWSGSSLQTAGILSGGGVSFTSHFIDTDAATYILIGGITQTGMDPGAAGAYNVHGLWVSYSAVKANGVYGPMNVSGAKQIIQGNLPTSGNEYFSSNLGGTFNPISIVQADVPAGASQLAIWVAYDRLVSTDLPSGSTLYIGTTLGLAPFTLNGLGSSLYVQRFGGAWTRNFADAISPTADLSKFKLYALIPATTATFSVYLPSLSAFLSSAQSFTGLLTNFYASYTPKYLEVNQNSMFLAGFSNAPSTVWFSDVGSPESIQPDSFFEVRTNDGDRILATKTYANQLIVMKENSFHKVIGDSPENFELVEVSTRYGCLSNKTVIEYEQKLLWLDKNGILEYNGANYDIISTPVEDIFRRMNVEAAKEKAVAVHEIYRNQVWFGIPVDGSTTNNMTVVYDYLVKAWTFFEGFNPASFALIKQDLTKGTVWRGDYSGMIYYHSASFLGDNGQAITCLVRPHWDKNKENETWIWRRFFLDVGTATGLTGRITGKLYSNYDNSTVQATFSMFQDAFQSRAEIGVVGKAVTTEFAHVSASLPLLINGYSWAKRFLRNV